MEYPNKAPANPLVSVCIQTYNHAAYIAQCIEGALMQETDFPFEIIIGEDESTDGTREICIEYAEKYPEKIRLFLRSEKDKIWINGIKTGRFNFVSNLKAARGKYVALCDGDDYWVDEGKLQKQFDLMEMHSQFVICFHDSIGVDEENTIVYHSKLKNNFKNYNAEELSLGPFLPTNTIFFRNIHLMFPKNFFKIINGDKYLFCLLGSNGGAVYASNVMNSVYRIHDGGIWSNLKEVNKNKNLTKTYKAIHKLHRKAPFYQKALHKYFETLLYTLRKMKAGTPDYFNFLLTETFYLLKRGHLKLFIKIYISQISRFRKSFNFRISKRSVSEF